MFLSMFLGLIILRLKKCVFCKAQPTQKVHGQDTPEGVEKFDHPKDCHSKVKRTLKTKK